MGDRKILDNKIAAGGQSINSQNRRMDEVRKNFAIGARRMADSGCTAGERRFKRKIKNSA
jgi:hypothetical protein